MISVLGEQMKMVDNIPVDALSFSPEAVYRKGQRHVVKYCTSFLSSLLFQIRFSLGFVAASVTLAEQANEGWH